MSAWYMSHELDEQLLAITISFCDLTPALHAHHLQQQNCTRDSADKDDFTNRWVMTTVYLMCACSSSGCSVFCHILTALPAPLRGLTITSRWRGTGRNCSVSENTTTVELSESAG
jgi:hypothetical protein